MAMGAEKVDYGTGWEVMFLIDSEAPRGLVDDLLHIPAGRVREVVSVHDDHRPKSAGPQTVHGFQGDLLVWSRFSRFDAKLPFELIGNARASADMTGCS